MIRVAKEKTEKEAYFLQISPPRLERGWSGFLPCGLVIVVQGGNGQAVEGHVAAPGVPAYLSITSAHLDSNTQASDRNHKKDFTAFVCWASLSHLDVTNN